MAGAANILAARNWAAGERVNQALETARQIERVRAMETETSSAARAYFITAQESFVSRARSSLAGFDSAWQQLFTLTADSPPQQQRLAQIASIEHAREERCLANRAFQVARASVGSIALPDSARWKASVWGWRSLLAKMEHATTHGSSRRRLPATWPPTARRSRARSRLYACSLACWAAWR